jgi:hypothetical protein
VALGFAPGDPGQVTKKKLCEIVKLLKDRSRCTAGVWRAHEGTSSGIFPGVSASDVQTMWLSPSGQYRREIVVEGGDGTTGAGGMIVDSGEYRFIAPQTFQYIRHSWLVCTAGGCTPGQPIGPNAGTLPFQLAGPGQSSFIGLLWTKVSDR